jgi:predicted Rossmann-fold nucleotide-binding protein
LAQTRKLSSTLPIILYGAEYWKEIINFEALVRHGMISREDLQLLAFADEPSFALGLLQSSLKVTVGEKSPAFAHSKTNS